MLCLRSKWQFIPCPAISLIYKSSCIPQGINLKWKILDKEQDAGVSLPEKKRKLRKSNSAIINPRFNRRKINFPFKSFTV